MLKDRIRLAREQAGLSQRALAKVMEMNHASISILEAGKREPTPRTLKGIADATGVNLEWLKTGEGPMYPEKGKPEPDDIDRLVSARGLSPEIGAFIRKLVSLTPDQMVAVTDFLVSLARELQELPPEELEPELDPEEDEDDIDEKVEAYRQALLLERGTEESGAS